MKDVLCTLCGKMFSKHGIKNHITMTHEGKIERFAHFMRPHTSWNKGLTKHSDDRVKLMGIKSGSTLSGLPGRRKTDAEKKKISQGRLKFLEANPDKVPWLLNHSSKMSWPEEVFRNALVSSGISGWMYNYQNGIYQYDFAFPELKIDVEIDGQQHLKEKAILSDERRDIFSKNQGWTVIRFPAKIIKSNVIACIDELKKYLATDQIT